MPGVVAVALARERHVQLVMEAVRRLGVVAPFVDRARVAHRLLGDQERARQALAELGENVSRAVVCDREGRVDT